jgi:hypothetical protein
MKDGEVRIVKPMDLRARLDAQGVDYVMPETDAEGPVKVTAHPPQMSQEKAQRTIRNIGEMLDLWPSETAVMVYVNDDMLHIMARGLRRAKVFACMRHRRAAENA